MICPNCGTELDDAAQACFLCGYQFQTDSHLNDIPTEQHHCPVCGAEYQSGEEMCSICGAILPQPKPQPTIEEEPVPEPEGTEVPEPTDTDEAPPQAEAPEKPKAKLILTILSFLIVAAVIAGAIYLFSNHGEKKDSPSIVEEGSVSSLEDSVSDLEEGIASEEEESLAEVTAAIPAPTPSEEFKPYTIQVQNGSLAIYDNPTYSGNVIGYITDQGEYTITKEVTISEPTPSTWGKLDGRTGWICLNDAAIYSDPPSQTEQAALPTYYDQPYVPLPTENTTVIGYVYIANVSYSVYLRSAPSTEASHLAEIPLGTMVGFIEYTDQTFSKVYYNGMYGYVKTKYLSTTAPVTTVYPSSTPEPVYPSPTEENQLWTITKYNLGLNEDEITTTTVQVWEPNSVNEVLARWDENDDVIKAIRDYYVDFSTRSISICIDEFESETGFTKLVIDLSNNTYYLDGLYDTTTGEYLS